MAVPPPPPPSSSSTTAVGGGGGGGAAPPPGDRGSEDVERQSILQPHRLWHSLTASKPSQQALEDLPLRYAGSRGCTSTVQRGFVTGLATGSLFFGGTALYKVFRGRMSLPLALPEALAGGLIIGSGIAVLRGVDCKLEQQRGVRDIWNKTAAGGLCFTTIYLLVAAELEIHMKRLFMTKLWKGSSTADSGVNGHSFRVVRFWRGLPFALAAGAAFGSLCHIMEVETIDRRNVAHKNGPSESLDKSNE